MSAPTLWEEGTMRARRVIRWAALACGLLTLLDVVAFHRLGVLFDLGFVAVCIASAVAVRPGEFFGIGVMPPFLLLGCVGVLALWHPVAVAHADDGFGQALVSGLAHHSGALFAGYVNALVVLGVRHRIMLTRRDRLERRSSPYYVGAEAVPAAPAQAKREGSPRPTLVTSGVPEEKSTTVVGSESVSPQSRTASSF